MHDSCRKKEVLDHSGKIPDYETTNKKVTENMLSETILKLLLEYSSWECHQQLYMWNVTVNSSGSRLPNRAHASNIDLRDLLNIAQP